MIVLGAAGLWWAAVQLQRSGVLPHAAMAVPPSLVHAGVMTFGFFPLFFCGFLFTTGPRWLHVRGTGAADLAPAFAAQAAGWLVWLAGSYVQARLAIAGLALACGGLLHVAILFWRLVAASTDGDRVHPIVLGAALTFGCACIAGVGAALWLEAPALARLFVLSGFWGCVAVVFVTAGHRMIPFFTAPPGSLLEARGDWAALALLVGVASFEAASVWLRPLAPAWAVVQCGVELAVGVVLLWNALGWVLARDIGNRLLRMLHTGVVWIALGFTLQGTTAAIALATGAHVLALAPLHAFAMGGLGSLMLAMVTRVSAGHGGIPVAADHFAWVLFWLLQAATVLRIAATVPHAPAQSLLTLAALLWALLMIAWGLRYGSVYGRPAPAPRHR